MKGAAPLSKVGAGLGARGEGGPWSTREQAASKCLSLQRGRGLGPRYLGLLEIGFESLIPKGQPDRQASVGGGRR